MDWYYVIGEERYGPVDEAVLRTLVNQGQVGPDDLVWNDTMGSEWKKCGIFFPSGGVPPVPVASISGSGGMMPNREITAEARAALSGNWSKAIGITVLYMVLVFGTSFLGSIVPVPGIVQFFILPPLMTGLAAFFLTFSRQQGGEVGDLFSGFRCYWASVGAYFFMQLFILLWLLPGIVAMIVGMVLAGAGEVAALNLPQAPTAGGGLLIVGGLYLAVVGVILNLRYAQIFFVLADESGTGALSAVRRSTELMREHKGKLFGLYIRFFGWSLLAMLLTFGIGLIWVLPYFQVACARFYDDLK